MDIKKLVLKITKKEKNIDQLEKCILKFYILHNKVKYTDSSEIINLYTENIDENIYKFVEESINSYILSENIVFNIDELVNIYELLIPEDEKKENGMVFTPKQIKSFMIKDVLKGINNKDILEIKICDPSCGCSSFLISVAKYINELYNVDFRYIYENIIYGVDIYKHNIDKSKILLHLLALENGEEIQGNIKFNLKIANSLTLKFNEEFPEVFNRQYKMGFDIVIGNPPYVRAKNMSTEVKESLELWKVCNVGTPDLYIAFFQIGLEILNKDGKLGYISINTYINSLNGRSLRQYFVDSSCNTKIINFKDKQIFSGVISYTCITIISKNIINNIIEYVEVNDIDEFKSNNYSQINMNDLDNKSGWLLAQNDVIQNIKKLERFKNKLGKYGVKNGIATLKNDIYIFKVYDEKGKYFYFRDVEGKMQIVEKAICKKIAKPNVIKNEQQLELKMEYIIFPYEIDKDNKYVVIEEAKFKNKYPKAYEYLEIYKDELLNRDKGKAKDKYPQWFAFGRTQGLSNFGRKILIPYMTGEPSAVLSLDKNVLYYCGYALFSENLDELNIIKKILLSNVFWYYVSNTSKCYSGGYMSLAKNYIKDFSIPDLTEDQKIYILSSESQIEINRLLCKIYDVEIE
ncbi:TPA: N-6 DNA methylase [Clostridioides difficile]|uniref:HsdM family class I SAM-dependent methyltransferase n=1 Tax=Clostridioides difficile TaxID=1496 RepID=UPI0009393285|nr:N-6 DNA methylase [Clostridioides difficile]